MSAKKLGRFVAGLFVALGLTFGGAVLGAATGGGASTSITAAASTAEIEWT